MGPHLTTAKHPPLERLKKKQPPLKEVYPPKDIGVKTALTTIKEPHLKKIEILK